MLLDRPQRPSESRGFVHRRIGGAIGGLLTGGPVGALGGFLGGGNPVIPTGTTDFTSRMTRPSGGGPPCPGAWSVKGPDGSCIDLSALGPGGRPALTSRDPRANGMPFDPLMHHPHEPFIDEVAVRRCGKGHVLSYQGLCVSKKELKNSDRMYPKPPRPLGTRSELKAVRVASSFGKRLKKNEKRLAKLGRALGGSSRGRH